MRHTTLTIAFIACAGLLADAGCASSSSSAAHSKPAAGTASASAGAAAKAPAKGRAWKTSERCVGFKADGSAAYVLLTTNTADNLATSASHWIAKVDLAGGKSSTALSIADERDCQSNCDDSDKDKPSSDLEPSARADKLLAAAVKKVEQLIVREALVRCATAKKNDDGNAFTLDAGATLRVITASGKNKKSGDDGGAAARDIVVAIKGKSPQKVFALPAEEESRVTSLAAVYYLAGKGAAVAVLENSEGGSTQSARAVRFER